MQYERHCTLNNECASHCLSHGLSSPKDDQFLEKCDVVHAAVCEDCWNVIQSIDLLKQEVQKISDAYERDFQMCQTEKCRSQIVSWQQHILRGLQQDKAKSTALATLNVNGAMWVRDWAQKILPGSGMEAQDVRKLYLTRNNKKYSGCMLHLLLIFLFFRITSESVVFQYI